MSNLLQGISIKVIFGMIAGGVTQALGGWDYAMQALVVFMVIDYLSGIAVALIFNESKKSDSGGFSSHTGFKGLIKKMFILGAVWMAHQVDLVIGPDSFVRLGVIFMFLANELGSITENYGLMGLPMPEVLRKAIDVLNKEDKEED